MDWNEIFYNAEWASPEDASLFSQDMLNFGSATSALKDGKRVRVDPYNVFDKPSTLPLHQPT